MQNTIIRPDRVVIFGLLLIAGMSGALHSQGSKHVAYEYDGVGRLIRVTYYDGSTISYSYDRTTNITLVNGTAVNLPPTSATADVVTDEDTPSPYVTPAVIDPDSGDTFTITLVSQPFHGTATINNNAIGYLPDPDFNGTDSLVFRATDAGGLHVDGIEHILVRPVNDPPEIFARLLPVDFSVRSSRQVSFVWSRSGDRDGDPLHYRVVLHTTGFDSTFMTVDTAFSFDFRTLNLSYARHIVIWDVFAADSVSETTASNGRGFFTLDSIPLGSVRDVSTPSAFTLYPSFPNPFSTRTAIAFDLSIEARIACSVFDANGRMIDRIYEGVSQPGWHVLEWNGCDATGRPLPDGLYFYTLRVLSPFHATDAATRSMILLR